MSRGPRKIQKTILQALQTANAPIQRNKLLWALAKQSNRIVIDDLLCENIRTGGIEDSYIKSYQRALKGLSDSGQITIKKRKLRDIDEFIEYYPYKTAALEIFLLRTNLLPLIKTYLEGPWSRVPYSVGDNELYILEKTKNEFPDRLKRHALHWRKIEKKIFLQLPGGKMTIRNLWVSLVMKGRQLFLDSRAKYGMAFHVIIEKIENSQEKLCPAELELLEEIQKFKRKVFKPEVMKHSRLKSKLHVVAYFGEGSRPTLTDEIKEHFLSEKPELVENLPDYHQPPSIGRHHFPPSFDPILDKLIDRHVFSKFEFLSV